MGCTHDCSSCSSDCKSKEQNLHEELNKYSSVKKVIGIVSGKGGVGKSLVTSMLAVTFNRLGKSTAVLDADITGPSIPKAFGVHERCRGNDEGIFPVVTETGIKMISVNLLLEHETDPAGLIQAKKGSIVFDGKELTKTPPHKIVSMGMAHVPEGRRIFQQLSVLENLKLGAYTRKDKSDIASTLKMVYERFPRLEERKNQVAGTLSGGEQQMLAMGRALMSKPRIILMDEPSMSLSPLLVSEIFDIIKVINESGNNRSFG